jgi:hypothetical protein
MYLRDGARMCMVNRAIEEERIINRKSPIYLYIIISRSVGAVRAKMPPLDASHDTVYFADVMNCRVRAVELAPGAAWTHEAAVAAGPGRIATVAGTGVRVVGSRDEPGDIGDGRPAREGAFSTHPMRLALDNTGSILVSDAHQARIRRIDATTGVMTLGMLTYVCGPAGGRGHSAPLARRDTYSHPLFIAFACDLVDITYRHAPSRAERELSPQVMITLAGNGESGFAGDYSRGGRCRSHSDAALCISYSSSVILHTKYTGRHQSSG